MGGFSLHLPDFSAASWLADSTYYLLPSSPNFCSTHLKADLPDGKVQDTLQAAHHEMM